MALINAERQSQGLTVYNSQGQLQAAARGHGTDMACNDFFSHTGSDGSSVGDRVSAQGYSASWVGENIFATSDTSPNAPESAFTWWMNSAPHRANLLSPNYTDIGIGYIYEPNSQYKGYLTAVFARPQN
ncbi:MAG: CAP domain-containing protein [Anaerolineales bacterium]